MIVLTTVQSVVLTFNPGVTFPNSLEWSIDDNTIATITPIQNTFTATLTAIGGGATTVLVSGTANTGVVYNGTIPITVVTGTPVTFAITAGTPQ